MKFDHLVSIILIRLLKPAKLSKYMDMKLEIELIPSSSWFHNVRSSVPRDIWDALRKKCYQKASNKCEICGGIGKYHNVECHEIWEYDDVNHIQTLTGLIALCPDCHLCKHIGLAQHLGRLHRCVRQLMIVNDISRKEVEDMIANADDLWASRSKYTWTINLDILSRLVPEATGGAAQWESGRIKRVNYSKRKDV